MSKLRRALSLLAWPAAFSLVLFAAEPALAQALSNLPSLVPPGYRAERVVLVYRHGVRAPLEDEIGARDLARGAWPSWSAPPSRLTRHGYQGMKLLGRYDRQWLSGIGLLPETGCPQPDAVVIRSNSESRTIESGQALAQGLAPGCGMTVEHRPTGVADPLFSAQAASPGFDMAKGRADVLAYTRDLSTLTAGELPAFAAMATLLGCDRDAVPCRLASAPSRLTLSADGRGLELEGPIRSLSGTAEVFLLEKAEGMASSSVAFGRASPKRLEAVSRLHARLFDVFDRSPLMAKRTSVALAQAVAKALGPGGPKLTLFVGHDNTIAALISRLGARFHLAGYGENDPPIGGALGFVVLRSERGGTPYVRLFYQAQTLDQLHDLTQLDAKTPPAVQILRPSCASDSTDLCPLGAISFFLR